MEIYYYYYFLLICLFVYLLIFVCFLFVCLFALHWVLGSKLNAQLLISLESCLSFILLLRLNSCTGNFSISCSHLDTFHVYLKPGL